MNDLRNIGSDLSSFSHDNLLNVLLYGYQKYDDKTNEIILMHNVRYKRGSQKFEESLFSLC